ncbi:MAG TPA: 3-hydroxyacyl-CoA dehydrogenase family protein [Acidothermaceae bacterium]|nr:3-hydroxyacyl-CoA dehydrogenase family protein [Acidothermaceae bacterium]
MAGRIAVIGAGLMGSGIAQVAAHAGYEVVLRDTTSEALDRALSGIAASQNRFIAKNVISADDAEAARARISTTTELADAAGAEFVVEAVFEQLEVKQQVFRELDAIVDDNTVLATNTTAIPITQIASVVSAPERVVGTHFFSPVPMMKLCELVRGLRTSDDTLRRAREFAESLGKTCVVVERDVAGFVTSRLLVALLNEAVAIVDAGVATAADVDVACQLGFGHTMGPLATLDLTGLDVILHAAENIYAATRDEKFAPPELLSRMVAAGRLGRKSGEGFYTYNR